MTRILGISGSLRKQSYNTALLRVAQSLAGPGTNIDIATLHGIPLYDGDVEERDGMPPAVAKLKDRIKSSDGIIIATPEYNNGMPGVLKNAIDWLSRPASEIPAIFHDRPFALIGATPGGHGTALSQTAWLPVLRNLRTLQWFGGRLMLSRVHTAFDNNGKLTDAELRERIAKLVADFSQFVAATERRENAAS